MKSAFIIYLATSLLFFHSSCTKLVEANAPVTSSNGDNVYESDPTAIAVITGIYTKISAGSFITGNNGISFFAGLSSDELVLNPVVSRANWIAYYNNNLSVTVGGFETWQTAYGFIFKCNAAIEGISKSANLSPNIKQQLLGEAKFMRAYFYFYLVNLYGDVPLVLTTDHQENTNLSKSSKEDVYNQIISDLKEAQVTLSTSYLDASLLSSTTDRVRPTKWAATALLSRVYLYTNDWANAELQATMLIENGSFSLANLIDVFTNTSTNKEIIWSLQPVNTGWNTEDARLFVINAVPSLSKPISISTFLKSAFEATDKRKSNWTKDTTINGVTYTYPYKYKKAKLNDPVTEYLILFRLGEEYLIRAEARAQQNKTAEANADLAAIRKRAGLIDLNLSNKSDLLTAITHERQVELFTEQGHRWLDLKRLNLVSQVMSTVTPTKANGATWQPFQALYPLPQADLLYDINLDQNPGYTN